MAKLERIFVGNLPSTITENELKNAFSAYGQINAIEFKSKTDPRCNDSINKFAFVTMNIDANGFQQCRQTFQETRFHDRFLTVSIAREHFLDKLKREREENDSSTIATNPFIKNSADRTGPIPFKSSAVQSQFPCTNKRITDFDESVSDYPTPIDDFVRKKSNPYIRNGKINIEPSNAAGLIQSPQEQPKEPKSHRAEESDKQRIKSLRKMTDVHQMKQQLIKTALANVGVSKSKITFDHDGDDEKKTKRKALFDDNDSDHSDAFNEQFADANENTMETKYQLQQLNSKFGDNKRFKMDASFLEDSETIDQPIAPKVNQERQWQFGVLEKVIGHKLHDDIPTEKKKPHKSMLRYDPAQSNALKNEQPISGATKEHGESKPQVSRERFYKISEDIKKSLGNDTTPFSLLNMFGIARENEVVPSVESNNFSKEILLTKAKHINSLEMNPFKYDSSSEEEDTIQATVVGKKTTIAKPTTQKSRKLWQETFFIGANDPRLTDGLEFFLTQKLDEDQESAQRKKYDLKNIVKKKIKRAINSKLPQGAKPNRRFKKFARNL